MPHSAFIFTLLILAYSKFDLIILIMEGKILELPLLLASLLL
ncbi:hypothetical protein VCHA57P526_50324 [Vibrio chagasii]|nr:hypothetical protein VCHA40O231_40323 [Vibrio chagasii]CAH7455563.1 hypothetical protein VCHA57P526_50324 [Vibrio chagasii]